MAVATKLGVRLSGDEIESMPREYPGNVEAYNLYLKGLYLWNMGTKDDLEKAIEYFESVIAIDPDYAPAYVGLARSYIHLYSYELSPSKDCFDSAKISALRAVSTDPLLAEAHAVLGFTKLLEWDWKAAERSLNNAIILNPSQRIGHRHNQIFQQLLLFY